MAELWKEALREITNKPVIFVAEVVQFAVLIGLVWFFAPRFIGQRLKDRRDRIVAELEEAAQVEREYAEAERKAKEIMSRARQKASEMARMAKDTAVKEFETAVFQADQEAEEIILRAKQTVEAEKNKVLSELSEQLVNLVTATTRRFIDEALTEGERQALTQKIILSSLEKIETTPA